jgi:hypothetical protein
MSNIVRRLSTDTTYKQPEKTYQQTLSNEDIAKKLSDYVKVKPSEIYKIPINTHIRYFTINPKNGEKQFRLGGTLSKFGDNNEYLILSNGTFTWSVQLGNSIIYKKLSQNELIETVKEETAKECKKDVADIIKENKQLKKMLKEIKDATLKSKK